MILSDGESGTFVSGAALAARAAGLALVTPSHVRAWRAGREDPLPWLGVG